VLVRAGTFRERVGRRVRTCTPGTAIFRPPGEDHSDEFFDAGRCVTLDFSDPAWFDDLIPLPGSVCAATPRLVELAARIDGELREADAAAALALEGLALEILAELVRWDARKEPSSLASAVEGAWAEIRDTRSNPLRLEQVASRVGAHPVSLARAFRRRYGMTIGDAIRRERVRRACELLASTDRRIADIAASCGFADQSHLARVFQRLLGTTPARYRG
jgi:AraC-like DNA-binding protein